MWAFAGFLLVSAAYLVWTVLWCRSAQEELYRVERSVTEPAGPELELYELAAVADNLAVLLLFEAYERGTVGVSASGYLTAEGRSGGRSFYSALLAGIEARPGADLLTVVPELNRQPELVEVHRELAARGLLRDAELRRRLDRAVSWGVGSYPLIVLLGVAGAIWAAAEHRNVLIPLGAFALLLAVAALVGDRAFVESHQHRTVHGDRALRAGGDDRRRDLSGQVALHGFSGLPEEHPLRGSYRACVERAVEAERVRAAWDHDNNGGGNGGI
ncbi:TIGR04222 domain-containing membrane protein [Kitasatospora sp. NPDC058190]|uniref:TIGR04222 domain-containing membrane protein n=1 Tax=Kitasatospora sp. NPDC058190 TaxID=3346371 RepID=UPI0036D769F0